MDLDSVQPIWIKTEIGWGKSEYLGFTIAVIAVGVVVFVVRIVVVVLVGIVDLNGLWLWLSSLLFLR